MLKENNKHYNVDELFLYSHDLLSEAERFAIDEHLLECEKCRPFLPPFGGRRSCSGSRKLGA